MESKKIKVILVWAKWGPYHHARYRALVEVHGRENCLGIALAGKSANYIWTEVERDDSSERFVTLNPHNEEETLNPLKVFWQLIRLFFEEKAQVVLLPSYWPAQSLVAILAARFVGMKCVMMNESHALTERATGIKRVVKRAILKLFGAGLVGGGPQIAHFTNLGMDQNGLFEGYDVVDNDYFSSKSLAIKLEQKKYRVSSGLPNRYILNLGRMVEKKNLSTLVRAYALHSQMDATSVCPYSLVLIGSGAEEDSLRRLSIDLGLVVRDLVDGMVIGDAANTVFFGGFRQIDQNPIFFALADVFVLPSHTEEWGLVVNEASACGVPLIVSETAGCAWDLVKDGINGYLFSPLDTEGLAGLLRKVLMDGEVRSSMSIESRRIMDHWSCALFATNAIKACHFAIGK